MTVPLSSACSNNGVYIPLEECPVEPDVGLSAVSEIQPVHEG